MDEITSDLPGVAVYLDDILCSGATAEAHLQNLRRLLESIRDKGLRCRLEKCIFAQPQVVYLGHVLSTEGIHRDHLLFLQEGSRGQKPRGTCNISRFSATPDSSAGSTPRRDRARSKI